jgi:hypothetical protein
MPYEETGKQKEKREAYYKANKERGIRAEKQQEYERFGTTEQNIPAVDTMGNVTGMKKGGKVMKKTKKFAGGGEITGAAEMARMMGLGLGRTKTAEDDLQDLLPNRASIGSALREKLDPRTLAAIANPGATVGRAVAKAAEGKKAPRSYADEMSGMKKGGSVKASSASKRADGCAIKGKTKGRMV